MEASTRFRLGVAAAALAGCAFGGVAFGPGFAGAQDAEDPTTTTTVEGDSAAGTEERPGGMRCGPGRHAIRAGLEAAAEAIGIEPAALREAIQGGQTIAEVAAANGVDAATVVDAMVADAEERIATAVSEGRITQEQADERLATLEERMTAIVNGEADFPEADPVATAPAAMRSPPPRKRSRVPDPPPAQPPAHSRVPGSGQPDPGTRLLGFHAAGEALLVGLAQAHRLADGIAQQVLEHEPQGLPAEAGRFTIAPAIIGHGLEAGVPQATAGRPRRMPSSRRSSAALSCDRWAPSPAARRPIHPPRPVGSPFGPPPRRRRTVR